MLRFKIILLGLILLHLYACSSESIKRNTYQSLKSMEQNECLKEPGRDCPAPESYNRYEKQREEELNK
jgi:hypothetical protein